MMLGSKVPNYDACDRSGSQGLSSTYEQAHVDLDFLTLAS